MNKLSGMLYKFMYGRYGNDRLNKWLLVFTLILIVLNGFLFHNGILNIITWILLFIAIFRCYSKNISKRQQENYKFERILYPFQHLFNVAKKQAMDKEHKYFFCPNCKQTVRVPKGKGKIVITCPKCRMKFDGKS